MTSLGRTLVPTLALALTAPAVLGEEGLRVGVRAPDFVLPNVVKGGQTALHDAVSKGIVIVHFWKSK